MTAEIDRSGVEILVGVKEAFFGWYDLIQRRGIGEVAAAISNQAVISKAELIALYLLGTTHTAWDDPNRAWNTEALQAHLEGSEQWFEKHPGVE